MSGENLRLSVLIEAQAEQARREMASTAKSTRDVRGAAEEAARGAADLSQALGGIGTPLRGAATAADGLRAAVAGLRPELDGQVSAFLGAASAGAAWEAELTALRAELNPAVAAHQQLTAAIDQVETAEALGAITAREATLAHDQLSRSLTALEARATELGISLTRIGPAAQAATSALQQQIDRQTGVTAASERSTAATLAHGRMLDDLRAKYNPLFAVSQRYEQELRDIAEAERLGAISANEAAAARTRAAAAMAPMTQNVVAFGQANGAAAAYTANLGYQVNDIAVMMAAGQNPFMLMMQQGTQVVQVFQQMQASGMSVGAAIRTSLMGMVSPMSLITMGVIGFGAATVTWLRASHEEVLSVEDAFDRLSGRIDKVRTAASANRAGGRNSAIEQQFGATSPEIARMIDLQERLARQQAQSAVREMQTAFTGLGAGQWFDIGLSDRASGIVTLRRELGLTRAEAEGLYGSLQQLAEIDDLDALASHYANLIAEFDQMRARNGELTKEQLAFYEQALAAEEKVRQLIALDAMKGKWDTQAGNDRLATLRAEAALAETIAAYGDESVEAARQRQAIERQGFEGWLEGLDITKDLREELRAAFDAAQSLAGVNLASGIAAARAEARAMADEIMRALGAAQSLANQGISGLRESELRVQHAKNPVALAGALARERMVATQGVRRQGAEGVELASLDAEVEAYARNMEQIERNNLAARRLGKSGGGRSRAERDDVAELISGLQSELDVLRELDPVQQEMIRHREALAGATDGERAMVEELIRTRNAEAEALDRVKQQMEDVRSLGHDVVRGLISDLRNGASAADIFANVLDRIADKLLDMGASGIADVLFGAKGSSGGGLLGGFLGSILGIKMNALGDVIGAPTLFAYGDKPGQLGVMGEAGAEAIMPLSHAMGAGVGAVMDGRETVLGLTRLASGKLGVEVPRPFALGGTFGAPHIPAPPMRPTREDHARSSGASAGIGGQARLSIALSQGLTAKLEGQMEGVAIRVVGAYGEELDRNLPARMAAISNDPDYRG